MTSDTLFPKIRIVVSCGDVTLSIGRQTLRMTPEALAPKREDDKDESSFDWLMRWSAQDYSRREIKSAQIADLATTASRALQRILLGAREARERLDRDISVARRALVEASAAYKSWEGGFFLKRLRKKRFEELERCAQEARASADELYDRRRRCVVVADIVVDEGVAAEFNSFSNAFRAVAASDRIWDTLSVARTNQVAERTSATESIERRRVKFNISATDMMFSDWQVPRLGNANGGDLYIYPGFMLYSESSASSAVIDIREVRLEVAPWRFLESEELPSDAKRVGQTWLKVNKDGSPDRRFAHNRPIPVLQYGSVSLETASGLKERYLVSNYEAVQQFAAAWNRYQEVLRSTSANSG